MIKGSRAISILLLVIGGVTPLVAKAQTSIPAPQKRVIFREDTHNAKKAEKKAVKTVTARDQAISKDMNLRAPKMEYSRDGKTVQGSGGVSLQSQTMSIESDTVAVQTETKDASFSGAVTANSADAKIIAESGTANLDSEAGTFECANARFEDSNYQIQAKELRKLDDENYEMDNAKFSTCSCADEDGKSGGSGKSTSCLTNNIPPWSIEAKSISMTRDGYAYADWAKLKIHGVPIFYTPWMGFPVKEERQSGLLAPTIGYNSEDGFKMRTPLFITLGETADATLSPFLETQTRTGLELEYRQKFSRYNQIESQFLYSNESARGSDLRGTDVSGLYDPTFDENRGAVVWNHYWRSERDSDLDLTYIADVHYVSDDLILREMPDSKLGEYTQTQTTSRALLRSGLGEYGVAELSGEYVQALDEQNDDLVLQRLPELNVNLSKSWRPFGYNDYGLKVVTALDYLADNFSRTEGYDGFRSHAAPSATVPFHIGPYVQGYSSVSLLRTDYRLNENVIPNSDGSPSSTFLDDSNDRTLPVVTAGLSTAIERVYAMDKDSWLNDITSWGAANQDNRLTRVKNTIEPFTRFVGIPNRDQQDLPTFDSIDLITEKRSLSYGVRTSLFGKFEPPTSLTQRNNDLVGSSKVLPGTEVLSSQREEEDLGKISGGARIRDGDSRELVTFMAKQNFDILEHSRDNDPDSNGLSDIDNGLYIFPTPQFALGLESSINVQDGKFSSWSIMTDTNSDRGDSLRARWNFVQDSQSDNTLISQFEGNAEVVLTSRLKAGIYSRLDELHGKALENRAALRWFGSCRCWHIDLGYGQRENPHKNELLLSFTLHGLGDIAQSVRVDQQNNGN